MKSHILLPSRLSVRAIAQAEPKGDLAVGFLPVFKLGGNSMKIRIMAGIKDSHYALLFAPCRTAYGFNLIKILFSQRCSVFKNSPFAGGYAYIYNIKANQSGCQCLNKQEKINKNNNKLKI